MSAMIQTTKKSKKSRSPSSAKWSMCEHVGQVKMLRTPENQTFTICQTVPEQTITQAAVAVNRGAIYTTLSLLSQVSEFTSLFDQYWIQQVQFVFRPQYLAVTLSAGIVVPCLYAVVDFDDANPPSSVAELTEYGSCNTSMFEVVTVTYQPHLAVAAYSGSFGSYKNEPSNWIDCNSPAVQHFGVKWAIDPGISGQTVLQQWTVIGRVKVAFRNVR